MLSFERMRVSTRLAVAGAAVFLGLLFLAGYTVLQIRNDELSAHSERIKDLVDSTVGVVKYYQKLEQDKKLSHEEAQIQAREAIRQQRFAHDDYYFIYDFSGKAVMVAGNPALEGKNMLGKTDAAGFKLWDAIVETGKSGSGYIDYVFPRPGQTEPKPKRGYVAGVPGWQWVVGTGGYVDDVDEAVRKAVISYGIMSLVILLAVAGIAIVITRSVVRQLGGEPLTVIELMTRAASGDLTVEVPPAPKGSILDSAGRWCARSARCWVRSARARRG